MENRSRFIFIGILGVLIVGGGIVFMLAQQKPAVVPSPQPSPPAPGYVRIVDAQKFAFERARQWQSDAKLVKIFPDEEVTDSEGRSPLLRVWFSSESASDGTGYEVVIQNGLVVEAREITLSRTGGDMPEGGIMSQEEALAYLHTLPGYEDAVVQYMDLYYERATGQWFWGVKTSKGELSVEAGRVDPEAAE